MSMPPIDKTFTGAFKDWLMRLTLVERRLAIGQPVPDRLAADLPSIPAGVDLNDIVETGWYIQRLSANATLALNYPLTRAGHLEVSGSITGAGYVFQTYTEFSGTNIATVPPRQYNRVYYNGAWSPWWPILDTLPPRLEGTTGTPLVTNCNDAIENGWYRASSAANAPVGTAGGSLMVYTATTAATNIRQEFRRVVVGDYRAWVRGSGDGGASWSAWSLTQRQTETGVISVPAINNATGTTITVTYANPFLSGTPDVFVQMQGTARVTTATLTKNTTACQIRFDNFSGANAAASTAVWQAMDPG